MSQVSHPAASRIPLYIGEIYKPCVSGLFLDDIRLATCPVESHRVGLSDASHNTLGTQPLFKFFLMSSDSEALFDTLMNKLIHQMSGQAAPFGNGRLRDFPTTDPAPDSTLLIVYSLLIIESRDAGFARRDPEELRRENRSNRQDMIGAPNPDYGTAAAVPESTRLRPHANNSEVRKAAWKLARADTRSDGSKDLKRMRTSRVRNCGDGPAW